MAKREKIQLSKAMSFEGVNYAPGLNEMPEKAAKYAVKRKFGTVSGGGSGESSTETASDFTPLSLEETVKRMNSLDLSDEVLDSIKAHRETIVEGVKSGKSLGEISGMENPYSGSKGNSEVEGGKTETGNAEGDGGGKTAEGLPEDFPMKHVFEKAGFSSVADVQALSREQLIDIDGIAEKTADKVLAYGK